MDQGTQPKPVLAYAATPHRLGSNFIFQASIGVIAVTLIIPMAFIIGVGAFWLDELPFLLRLVLAAISVGGFIFGGRCITNTVCAWRLRNVAEEPASPIVSKPRSPRWQWCLPGAWMTLAILQSYSRRGKTDDQILYAVAAAFFGFFFIAELRAHLKDWAGSRRTR